MIMHIGPLSLIEKFQEYSEILKKKTLIIVHKEFLLRQWVERIEQFLPDARVGTIKQNIIETEDKDLPDVVKKIKNEV